jgi:hypothetical protein
MCQSAGTPQSQSQKQKPKEGTHFGPGDLAPAIKGFEFGLCSRLPSTLRAKHAAEER